MGELSDRILEQLTAKGPVSEDALRNSMCAVGNVHPDALASILSMLRREGRVRLNPKGRYEVLVPDRPDSQERALFHPEKSLPAGMRRCRKCGDDYPLETYRIARGHSRIHVCAECARQAGRRGFLKAQETRTRLSDPKNVLVHIPPEDCEEETTVPQLLSANTRGPSEEEIEMKSLAWPGATLQEPEQDKEPPHVPLDLASPDTIKMTLPSKDEVHGPMHIEIEFLLCLVDIDGNTHRIQMDAGQMRDLYKKLGLLVRGEV